MKYFALLKVVLSLGLLNVCRVAWYRFGLKFGWNRVLKITAEVPEQPFFKSVGDVPVTLEVNDQWINKQTYFGWYEIKSADVPVWQANFQSQQAISSAEKSWWLIPDFDEAVGDIKNIWEASRFDWVLCHAQAARTGDLSALDKLNNWLDNWLQNNPPYTGANWKCGQETSIRVMHLCIAALLLKQHDGLNASLQSLLIMHLQRIEPTLAYAVAQDNNHGTSEAAALYIGGACLNASGNNQGKLWQQLGAHWLENRAKRLITEDGSFSQYSMTYHRVVVDTYSMAEIVRRKLNLPAFSEILQQRLSAASNWLYQMVQEETGDAPNFGANDGARLLPLTATDYRDFKPTVQLASVLFEGKKAWKDSGAWDLPLQWLEVDLPDTLKEPARSSQFDGGGYYTLRKNSAFAMLNYPRFKFRPSQADVLHVDLWHKGENLLSDAGTYSYNPGDVELQDYFTSTQAHNTVQFDGRNQMKRISRFLFGGWLKPRNVSSIGEDDQSVKCASAYVDNHGASHQREIELFDDHLLVNDVVAGFDKKAILRWRLKPGEWVIDDASITNGTHRVCVSSDRAIARMEIVQGYESRYYFHKAATPVLEVEISESGSFRTEYYF